MNYKYRSECFNDLTKSINKFYGRSPSIEEIRSIIEEKKAAAKNELLENIKYAGPYENVSKLIEHCNELVNYDCKDLPKLQSFCDNHAKNFKINPQSLFNNDKRAKPNLLIKILSSNPDGFSELITGTLKREQITTIYENFKKFIIVREMCEFKNFLHQHLEIAEETNTAFEKENAEKKRRELEDYINAWKNCTVTLTEWQKFWNVYFRKLPEWDALTEEEKLRIRNHQRNLYTQFVDDLYSKRFAKSFEQIGSTEKKLLIARRDLDLIQSMIKGEIDSIKKERIDAFFGVRDWKNMTIQMDCILRNQRYSDEKCDIHGSYSFANAEALLRYNAFLESFIAENQVSDKPNSISETISSANNKIKVNLTVPELAFLFRVLYDNGLIEVKNKTDLFKSIAEVFQTKKTDTISSNSVKNNFDMPDFKAVDFWYDKLVHLRQTTQKFKEKK
ncbi:MAG: hypothetical protein WCM76_14780 [Bacteroidota bacterium]